MIRSWTSSSIDRGSYRGVGADPEGRHPRAHRRDSRNFAGRRENRCGDLRVDGDFHLIKMDVYGEALRRRDPAPG